MATLQKQAENAKLRKQIELDKLSAQKAKQYKQYLNKNLLTSRKRKVGWSSPSRASRDLSTTDRKQLIAEARQLVEENPLAAGILRSHLDFVVGAGYALSMRSEDTAFNKKIEKIWKIESDQLDARGLRSFGGLQRMFQARKIVDGDIFANLTDDVEAIEADRCYKDVTDSDDVGIDFSSSGRPTAYYFGRRATSKESQNAIEPDSFDADQIVPFFNFSTERAERERGVSAFLQLMNLIKDIDENLEAMDIKAKNEAFMGLFFEMEPNADGDIFSSTVVKADDSGTERGHVKMVNGLNVNGMPGEKISVIESKSPHENYVDYIRFRLRMAGVPLGIPLEFLMADASETNYSGLMMLSQMYRRAISHHQKELERFSTRIFMWWLERKVKTLDGVPDDYMAHAWGKPGFGFIDPLKEAKAYSTLLDAKLTTRQDILSLIGNGDDFEGLADQTADEFDYFDSLKIPYSLGAPGSPIANLDRYGLEPSGSSLQSSDDMEDDKDEEDEKDEK